MTVADWLAAARQTLQKASIETARLDSLVLLEFVIGQNRSWLLANPNYQLQPRQGKLLDRLIARRTKHEPIAYIIGKTEFYGREFYIDRHVLEPRPESETMIDLLKKLNPVSSYIIDIGTGSGALAITAKLELPNMQVLATDIDESCLNVAHKNTRRLGGNIKFHLGDLLTPIPAITFRKPTILLANLPYVPDSFQINPAAMNEPKIAIFGGPDGLDIYRKLFQQIDALADKPRTILAESMPLQHEDLAHIASDSGYSLTDSDDFIQLFSLIK